MKRRTFVGGALAGIGEGGGQQPSSETPRPVLDAGLLPTHAGVIDIEGLRERLAGMTSTWRSPRGDGYRLLTGRVDVPARGAQPAVRRREQPLPRCWFPELDQCSH